MTLCADEVLTPFGDDGDHQSGAQLTQEGLPLALARRPAEQTRMVKAVAALEKRGEAVTSRVLAAAAHISREHCVYVARVLGVSGTMVSKASLSVLRVVLFWHFR